MFGSDGRPRELWSGADLRASDRQHQCVVEQAEEDGARSGLSVPGARQLGENVADFGGVRLAYEALAARLGPAIQRVDQSGTSPAQRFFYRYAQNYCTAQSGKGLQVVGPGLHELVTEGGRLRKRAPRRFLQGGVLRRLHERRDRRQHGGTDPAELSGAAHQKA